MGKLISSFFQVRRILKLCPFLMLTLLSMMSIVLVAGDRYGYKFYPHDEHRLSMIIIVVTVVLTVISILSMIYKARIRTVPSLVLPLFALAFGFALYLGTNLTKDTFLLLSGAVIACSFFVCVVCGRRGFFKQLIILATVLVVAGIGYLEHNNKELKIDEINITKVDYLLVSEDGKTQIAILENSKNGYSVYSNDTGRNIDVFFGEMKKIKSNLICNSEEKPNVKFKTEDIILVNDKEYKIKRG